MELHQQQQQQQQQQLGDQMQKNETRMMRSFSPMMD